jgi:PleD family two-component response regulator
MRHQRAELPCGHDKPPSKGPNPTEESWRQAPASSSYSPQAAYFGANALPVSAARSSKGPINGDNSLRVLVVDDCKDNADCLAIFLSLLANVVKVAYCGEVAIATAHVHYPDVVFLDLAMPKMDGCEVVKR